MSSKLLSAHSRYKMFDEMKGMFADDGQPAGVDLRRPALQGHQDAGQDEPQHQLGQLLHGAVERLADLGQPHI